MRSRSIDHVTRQIVDLDRTAAGEDTLSIQLITELTAMSPSKRAQAVAQVLSVLGEGLAGGGRSDPPAELGSASSVIRSNRGEAPHAWGREIRLCLDATSGELKLALALDRGGAPVGSKELARMKLTEEEGIAVGYCLINFRNRLQLSAARSLLGE
ncbi:MAG: hypothetical protein IT384_29095 [Deltaproteobacteria bacterium]|nr:hypothetical protein [Deltaproteobacteria bacterium]